MSPYIEKKGGKGKAVVIDRPPKPQPIRKDERGKQIGLSGIYQEAIQRFDRSDFREVKPKGKPSYYISRKKRLVNTIPAKDGHSWKQYRSVTPPKRREYRQLVMSVAWKKGQITAIRKGYSSKRRVRGAGEEQGMFQEAFFSSKKDLGFSPDSYVILNHYWLTWNHS